MVTHVTPTHGTDEDSLRAAQRVLERWRRSGFDAVLCHPSGYCSPANSSALALRAQYDVRKIDTPEALDALARAIANGMEYRA
jgi:hypothetical protein